MEAHDVYEEETHPTMILLAPLATKLLMLLGLEIAAKTNPEAFHAFS